MLMKHRVGLGGLAVAGLATTAVAAEPVTTAAEPRLLNVSQLLTADDYPAEALLKRQQGAVAIRLTIGADGHVSGCKIEKSSGSRSLDSTSCRIYLERARYEPVASVSKRVVHTHLDWRLGAGISRRGWFQMTVMAIKADGSIASCRFESSGAPDTDCTATPFPAAVAANFVKLAGYEPAKLVTEIRYFPEGDAPEQTGRPQLLSHRAVNITVKNDGTQQNCEIIDDGGSAETRNMVCWEASQYRFESAPHAPKAKGAVYFWTYLEPKPPGL
jgi:TonB family protein